MKNKPLKILLGMSVIGILGGCTPVKKNAATTTTTSITKTTKKSTKATTTTTSSSKETKPSTQEKVTQTVEAALWNPQKQKALNVFMNTWEVGMNQSYQEYSVGNSVNYYGINIPDQLFQGISLIVDQKNVRASWWKPEDKIGGYQIVAVYADQAKPVHCYLFVLVDGVPKVLVGQEQGYYERSGVNFKETANTDLKQGFAKIVGEKQSGQQATGQPASATKETKAETTVITVPGYTKEEVLAARAYLAITKQNQLTSTDSHFTLAKNPASKTVVNSQKYHFNKITYTLSVEPLANGEFTFSDEGNNTILYYRLPKNYRDPQWMDENYSNQEAKRILDTAETIHLGNYSEEALLSVLKQFRK